MEGFLIFCLIVVLLARWIYLRNRLDTLEGRIADLSAQVAGHDMALTRLIVNAPPVREAPRPEPPPESKAAPPPPPYVGPPVFEEPGPQFAQPTPQRSSADWEALLGGNWLNKLGVFVLVIGIALALGYSFTRVGPLGRVLTSIAASLAMLAAGAVIESREKYRIFARGLLGGGWAALYTTVYAMHAVDAARVIESPVTGFLLLLGVSAGMIVHSLRYRSQTVTGMAYFVAFGTLAITEATRLPLLALIPLAATLLYVSHRFAWSRMVLLGLVSTYAVCILRGDSGSALWQAQAIFITYWLLFEIFDLLHPDAWLLPLNAAGFLGLSLMKWHNAAPDQLWMFLAAAAAAYLASAVARSLSGKWHGAATLAAALAAAAIFQKLDHQWVASALVVEAELFYLAGVRLRAPYLRWLGSALFGIEVGRLLASDVETLPVATWAPVASLDAVVFYANRAIFAADQFYGFAGAGMLALVVGKEAPDQYRSIGWLLLAAGALACGWWRRLFDFRLQGYLLGILGLGVAIAQDYEPPLAVAAALSYGAVLCVLRSAAERFRDGEDELVRLGASVAATAALVALVWRMAPAEYLGLEWMVLALPLLELGLRGLPAEFRRLSYAVAMLGTAQLWLFNLMELSNTGPWAPRLAPAGAALLAYAMAARAARRGGHARLYYWLLGTVLTTLLLYYQISGSMLTVAWGIEGAALLASGFPLRERVLRISGLALLLSCILKLFVWDLRHLDTLPRIFSFIVLGLILVGVSWVYTRFREHVAKYL